VFGRYAEAMRYLEDVADTVDPACRGDPGYPARGLTRADAAMYTAHRERLEQILQARERDAHPEEAERYARELEAFERYQREREAMRLERAREREARRPEEAAAESHEGALAPQVNRANEQANAQVDSNVHEPGAGVRQIAPPAASERVTNRPTNEDGATASGGASERQANEGERQGNGRHEPVQATSPEASENTQAGARAAHAAQEEAANVLAFRAAVDRHDLLGAMLSGGHYDAARSLLAEIAQDIDVGFRGYPTLEFYKVVADPVARDWDAVDRFRSFVEGRLRRRETRNGR
jgi:hypothetical protein